MGFQPGNVLEPSCGIGNFFGLLPETLSGANLYGVELDGLTGRIARQLYQKANITVNGFENTDHRTISLTSPWATCLSAHTKCMTAAMTGTISRYTTTS